MTDLLPRSEGRELDALIHERLFGYTRHSLTWVSCGSGGVFECKCGAGFCSPPWSRDAIMAPDGDAQWCGEWAHRFAPRYSSDIASAFLVVEAMRAKGAEIRITQEPHNAEWEVTIWLREKIDGEWWFSSRDPLGKGLEESLPLAICRAALAALDAQLPDKAAVESPSPSASVEPLRQNT